MHTVEKVREIKRLLDEGAMSQRQIAKKLGVARGTVNSIANGTRGDHGREMKGRSRSDDPREMPQGRCPQCGVIGYIPCVACEARAYRSRQQFEGRRAA